jgi:hypothetical protein
VEGRLNRSGQLVTPSGSRMTRREEMVQPPVDPPRRLSGKAKAVKSSGHGHRPKMAKVPVISTSRGARHKDSVDPTGKKPLLSAAATGAHGGRVLRMERRGIQHPTPSWMLLKRKQLREGQHFRPHERAHEEFKKSAKGRPRTRRYGLDLPKKKPWTKTSHSALRNVFGADDLGEKALALFQSALQPGT